MYDNSLLMWFHHLVNLLQSSSQSFFVSIGTTVLGFIAVILDSLISIGISLYRVLRKQGVAAVRQHWKDTAKIALQTLFCVTTMIYGPIFVYSVMRTVYDDHQKLVSEKRELLKVREKLTKEVDSRKHGISTTDPVFPNTIYLLQAFDVYRHFRRGAPCVLYVSATPGDSGLSSAVAQFSNSVSDCFTFGPLSVGNPDIDKFAREGAIPGRIVFHAVRTDAAANELFNRLSNLLPLTRSFDMPTNAKELYSLPDSAKKARLVWLQFGDNVMWRSQRDR